MVKYMVTDFIKAMVAFGVEGDKPKNAVCFYLIISSLCSL